MYKISVEINPINKKGARQPKEVMWFAKNKLSGTPATVDTEKAAMTVPKALPLRSNGIESATMVCTKDPKIPPNAPANALAINSVS